MLRGAAWRGSLRAPEHFGVPSRVEFLRLCLAVNIAEREMYFINGNYAVKKIARTPDARAFGLRSK